MVTVAVVSSSCSIAAGSSAAPADSCCSRSRASWSIAVVEEVDTCFFIAAVVRWTAKPATGSMLEHGRVLFFSLANDSLHLRSLVGGSDQPHPLNDCPHARDRRDRKRSSQEKVVTMYQQLSPGIYMVHVYDHLQESKKGLVSFAS